MKNIRYFIILLCTLFFFTACEKETEGVSGVMHFELKGEQTMLVTLGTSYQEPGFNVIYRDQDMTKNVEVVGEVDANRVGLYNLAYVFANSDGVKTTRTRKVIVSDPTVLTDIAGSYVTADGTFRTAGGAIIEYPGFNIKITKIAPGFFQISDFLGGYYDQRAKYGAAYACYGYVQLKNDNTISLLSSSTLPWNDTLTAFSEGKYDPETNAVSWVADYAGMSFTVVLKKK